MKIVLAPKPLGGLDGHIMNILKINIYPTMQHFEGVGFGWYIGLRCAYLIVDTNGKVVNALVHTSATKRV